MCEGPSLISGPIPPDPSLFPEYYKRPTSARGRLEGNRDGSLALLPGPLAPDPVLYPGCYSSRVPPRPARISPNAAHILERGQRGVMGTLLKMEGVSFTPNAPKQKQQIRDYGKENVRRLREIQRRCREQEAEREHARPVPVKALWSSPKYQDVPSRFMDQPQTTSLPMKPQCQNFLRAHSKCGSAGPPRPQHSASPCTLQYPTSCNSKGKQNTVQLQIQGKTIDFMNYNARAAGKTALRRCKSLTNLRDKSVPSAVKGRVPQYLEERKEQWRREEEERKKNTPDPTVPAGHALMAESERQDTLQSLQKSHQSLVGELLGLPVGTDTLSIRSRRADLERKLSEMEEAIKIFSRDKVYVKIDS